MIVKTRKGDGGFNGDLGATVKCGDFVAIAYGRKKDITKSGKAEYSARRTFNRFAVGEIANLNKRHLLPSKDKWNG